MTSNIGADIIQTNFEKVNDDTELTGLLETTKIEVIERLKQTVRPEFINRIDDIIMFKPLLSAQIRQIVELHLHQLQGILKEKEINLTFTNEALDYLGREGFEPQYGARPLKRLIQKEVVNVLSKKILAGEISKNGTIEIAVKNGELFFENK